MDAALGTWNVSIGGVPLTILANPDDPKDDTAGYDGSFETQESTNRVERRDVPKILGARLSRGFGFIERRSSDDDGGYAYSTNGHAHFGDGWRAAGRRQTTALASISGGTAALDGARFIGIREYGNSVYFIADLGCVIKFTNGDPTSTPVYDPALNYFSSATDSLHAGYEARAIEVFDNATGASCLYVGSFKTGTGARIYQRDSAGTWTSATLTNNVDRFAKCFWGDERGVGANRLHTRSDATHELRHVIQGDDPMDPAKWVTPIEVGDSGSQIQQLVAAPLELIPFKTDGFYTITPFRTAPLTPYWAESKALNEHAAASFGFMPARIYGNHIYAARGLGMDRYDLRVSGQIQRLGQECGPSFGTQDGHPIRGWVTALGEHDGWLLAAVWNPDNKTTYIGRAIERPPGDPHPNPLVWHFSECTIPPVAGVGKMVTAMHVGAPTGSGATLASIKQYLWLCYVRSDSGGAGIGPSIDYVEMPTSGGGLSQTVSGGTYAYAASAEIIHTGQSWDDRNALKPVRRYDNVSARTSATNPLALKMRADGDPTTIDDDTSWTLEGTITSNSQPVIPETVKSGRFIQVKVVSMVASPYTTAPVSYEVRVRVAVRYEVFDVRILHVVLQRNYELRGGTPDIREPDDVLDSITAFQLTADKVYVDEVNRSYRVLVEQGIRYRKQDMGDGTYKTIARVECSLVKALS